MCVGSATIYPKRRVVVRPHGCSQVKPACTSYPLAAVRSGATESSWRFFTRSAPRVARVDVSRKSSVVRVEYSEPKPVLGVSRESLLSFLGQTDYITRCWATRERNGADFPIFVIMGKGTPRQQMTTGRYPPVSSVRKSWSFSIWGRGHLDHCPLAPLFMRIQWSVAIPEPRVAFSC